MILPCSAILAGRMLSGSWASNWKGKGRSKETPRILIPTSLRAKVKGAEVNASSRTMICPCSIIRFFIFKENGKYHLFGLVLSFTIKRRARFVSPWLFRLIFRVRPFSFTSFRDTCPQRRGKGETFRDKSSSWIRFSSPGPISLISRPATLIPIGGQRLRLIFCKLVFVCKKLLSFKVIYFSTRAEVTR